MKPWKVYYEGSLWGHRQRDHAGREIRLDYTFLWGERRWLIPAIYVCARGLVMDLCVSAPGEEMKAFLEKWLPVEEKGNIPEEIRQEIEREHPLRIDIRAELLCNGHRLRQDRASGSGWVPELCRPEGYHNDGRAEEFAAHYGLDRERAWAFRRIMFPWGSRRGRREIRCLDLELSEYPAEFSGPSFAASEGSVVFPHPFAEKEYTLTVIAEQEDELPSEWFPGEDMEYPRRCITLRYRVDPPAENVTVRWCGRGDAPKAKRENPHGPSAACATGVIMREQEGDEKSVVSALYFDLPPQRRWRITLQEKLVADGAWHIIEEKSI